jgi:thiol:disulfide interchange protein DsbA
MKKLLLGFAFSALLTACGSKPEPVSDAATQADAAAGSTASTPAPSDAELTEAATATQESASAEVTASDATLVRMVGVPENVQLPGGKWKAGTHYRPLVPAQATNAGPGEVEVLEFFWLGCPHCYELQPYMDAWKQKKASFVKFTQEHVMWGPGHRAQGRLVYTLDALQREDLLTKAFEQVHRYGNNLAANTDAQSLQMQVAFAKANGISEADYKREFNGFAVTSRLNRAEQLGKRYRVDQVPTFIVNGKYMTDVGMAGGPGQLVELLNDLAASEKSR